MTKAEMIAKYGIDYYNECRERQKERYATDPEFREYMKRYVKNYNKERYATDPEFRKRLIEYKKEYQKEHLNNDQVFSNKRKEYLKKHMKEYHRNDLNSSGKTKTNVRSQSRYILFDKRKHTRFKDYQIHHAFGYDDPTKFIYIPKSLHIKIHKYLRDNKIDADSNHYEYIKYMINECEEYTYISV